MPLARISHLAGKSPAQIRAMSAGIQAALVAHFNVPANDLFQIITEHAGSETLISASSFLDISHTSNLVYVQITISEGRTVAMKKALFYDIAHHLARDCGVRKEDVIITLIEGKRENWSFGNGLMQFPPAG